MNNFYFTFFLFHFFSLTLCSQQYISGKVVDKPSGEILVGATIKNGDSGTYTDQNGDYSLAVHKEETQLIASYLGYVDDTISINEIVKGRVTFKLQPFVMDEVVIVEKRLLGEYFGRENITIETINKTPTLLGEKDVIKSLISLPGISGGSEVSSELFVRGGNGDQNLILLDGNNIFTANHLFGFISPFNPYAIKTVELYKGGFPAKFGGRLSSIIDMTLDPGSFTTSKNELTIGLLNSYFKNTSPIIKQKLTLTTTGRLAYPIALASVLNSGGKGPKANYYLYDGSVKLSYLPTTKSALSFSIYKNQDFFTTGDSNLNNVYKNKFSWGNFLSSINYSNQIRNNLRLKSSLHLSKYKFGGVFQNTELDELKIAFKTDNEISEYTGAASIEHILKPNFRYQLGVFYSRSHMVPYQTEVIDYTSDARLFDSKAFETNDFSSYFSVNYNPVKPISIEAGLRYQIFNSKEFNQSKNLQPRLKINFDIGSNLILNTSCSKMTQPIQKVTNNSSYIPNDIWMPPLNQQLPSTAEQISVGIAKGLNLFDVSIEGFYKRMNHLNQILPNNFILVPDLSSIQNLAINGVGNARGIEVSIRKKQGNLTGGLYYTLSKSTRQFDKINSGLEFPFKFDRRHDFEGNAHYQWNKQWSISGAITYTSGYRVTVPDKILVHPDATGNASLIELTRSINNGILRSYFRSDFTFNKEFTNRFGKEAKWSFGVYNFTGYRNPLYIDSKKQFNVDLSVRGRPVFVSGSIDQKAVTPLRWIPFVNYSIKF